MRLPLGASTEILPCIIDKNHVFLSIIFDKFIIHIMLLIVLKVKTANWKASEVSSFFDKENIPFHSINHVNWAEYPYQPEVKFRIAHDGNNILLNYQVEESDITAVCNEDNGKVWEDSCVEFFISFAGEKIYYNIETNCIGKVLVGTGEGRNNRQHLPAALLSNIDRLSSLGNSPVAKLSGKWELSLVIPKEIFALNSLDGQKATGNFYKCGDHLKVPHFLSWNPIHTSKPDFHVPQFFGDILFEDR
jgi:hypothetical protein